MSAKIKTKSGLSAIFSVNGEMVANNGEDSFYYGVDQTRAIVAAFDGCGGIGSRRYANFSGKTGAYVASRAVCGGVKNWFEAKSQDTIKSYMERALKVCSKHADKEGRLMGSLGKSFPTTAAIIESEGNADKVTCKCYWAGDSRCYMLDEMGLHQLSLDDIDGEDAFSNISGDGVLTNVINASTGFEIHEKRLVFKKPCILIAASDGCFGYLNSPMEFEYMLLDTLMRSASPGVWKQTLDSEIRSYTGDDYTLCVSVYAQDNFQKLKKSLEKRHGAVYREYIAAEGNSEDKWNKYKDAYSMYL